jgi:sodium/potassium-transporting ATPase subunit alpha
MIVNVCRKSGHIVTVVASGDSDMPALKRAQLGITVQHSVSAIVAAKGNMVVDSWKAIVDGIREGGLCHLMMSKRLPYFGGRLLYDNLVKTIAYTAAHLMPEMMAAIIPLLFGVPECLSTMQFLLIDLLTELPPAIALVYEPAETDLMMNKPRMPEKRLVGKAKKNPDF